MAFDGLNREVGELKMIVDNHAKCIEQNTADITSINKFRNMVLGALLIINPIVTAIVVKLFK